MVCDEQGCNHTGAVYFFIVVSLLPSIEKLWACYEDNTARIWHLLQQWNVPVIISQQEGRHFRYPDNLVGDATAKYKEADMWTRTLFAMGNLVWLAQGQLNFICNPAQKFHSMMGAIV